MKVNKVETLHKRCAGLDVHSETIVACVLLGDSEAELERVIETFPTLTKDLFRLLKWLEEKEVTLTLRWRVREFIGNQFTTS